MSLLLYSVHNKWGAFCSLNLFQCLHIHTRYELGGKFHFMTEIVVTVINKGLWLSRSPDMNPCDSCLWFMLNDQMYCNNPCTTDDMGERKKLLRI